MIKVSVIVPIYNMEKYLEKCLKTLINQSLKDIEIILVNDGSEDSSEKIIKKYEKKYSNIKGYNKKNGGLSDTRNFGIKKAKGEYISFIDSDDYIEKDMLEKMYNYAKKNELDIVVCDSISVFEYQNKEVLVPSNCKYSDDIVKNYLLAPPMACTRIFKKELFERISFKKDIFYEDLEMCPKIVNYTNKIGFVEEGLYYYLQRSGSIMKQKNFNNRLLDIFDVLESNKNMLFDKYPVEIEYMYITHLLRTGTLRFIEYNDTDVYIDKIIDIFKREFPNWHQNIYYKKSSLKLKIICNLSFRKQIKVLKILKKIYNK